MLKPGRQAGAHEIFQALGRRGRLPEEHCMGRQDTDFYRRAFLIDARRALTAMDDLTGGQTDRVKIF